MAEHEPLLGGGTPEKEPTLGPEFDDFDADNGENSTLDPEGSNATQLKLFSYVVEERPEWWIDEETRAIGRSNLPAAREAAKLATEKAINRYKQAENQVNR